MTDGGAAVTNGNPLHGPRGRLVVVWLFFAAVGAVTMVANALSTLDDRAAAGQAVPGWQPWVWEASSFFGWALLVPVVLFAVDRLRPPHLPLAAALGLHLLLTAIVSLVHVGVMVGLRILAYAAAGSVYRPGPFAQMLLYEYRKDAATYVIVALLYLLTERLAVSTPSTPALTPAPDFRLEVKDRGTTRWIAPADIEWAQAAGNYVELHGSFGTLLLRRSLAALADELEPHGFRRIHRARLVRSDAVQSLEVRQSGDFEVLLASGTRLAGSRRYR